MSKAADFLTEDEQLLILDFRFLDAVKALRVRLGLDLRTAKALVDKYGVEEGLKVERDCEVCQGTGKVSDWKQPPKVEPDRVSTP